MFKYYAAPGQKGLFASFRYNQVLFGLFGTNRTFCVSCLFCFHRNSLFRSKSFAMAKQCGYIKVVGTFDNLCCYKMNGEFYVRSRSSLTSKKVKYSPRFRNTMMYAGLLGRASKIASMVYKDLPKDFRQFWMYRAFTGEAMQLLKVGKTDKETLELLWNVYASMHYDKIIWKGYSVYKTLKCKEPGNTKDTKDTRRTQRMAS